MSRYKISDLEKLSNIKAHTIRIWEQRYGLLTPLRTNTNIRFYDDSQLKRLLNVVSLVKAGYKISAIGKFSEEDIREKLESINWINVNGAKEEALINQLVNAGLSYDEQLFEKTFSASILSFGVADAYLKVFYPTLIKMGLLWSVSKINPAQEHFVSNLLKQKLFASIDAVNVEAKEDQEWLLFLPEGEDHDLGLLVANYLLRTNGKKVYYLGANVPYKNVVEVSENVGLTHLVFFVVKNHPIADIQNLLNRLSEVFGKQKVYLCCHEGVRDQLKFNANQSAVCAFEQFLALAKE